MCLAVLNSKRSNIVELLIVTFAIFTLSIMHVTINIVFAFPWNDCNIQNYAKGWGQIGCTMGNVIVTSTPKSNRERKVLLAECSEL